MTAPFPHCPVTLPDGRQCAYAKGHGGGHSYGPAAAGTHAATPGPSPVFHRLSAWLPAAAAAGVALVLGIAIGAAGGSPGEPEIVTETVSASAAEQKTLDEREAKLDEQAEQLDERKAGLDERADEIDKRESALVADEKAAEANTVGDGIWTVGVDIKPGTYRATDVGADCYWGILVTGSNGADIVNNGIPGGGSPTVTVQKGQDFESNRCGDWKLVK